MSYVMPSPAPPPEPGAEEAADAETVVAAAAWNRFACLAPEPAPAANQTPPPLCSGVLAAAVRHLRREAPWALELVDVEPGLPGAEAFWYDCRERGLLPPAPCQQRQQRQQRQQQCASGGAGAPRTAAQPGVGAAGGGPLRKAGGNRQLSVAERTRLELQRRALKQAGGSAAGGPCDAATPGNGFKSSKGRRATGGLLRRVGTAARPGAPPAKRARPSSSAGDAG